LQKPFVKVFGISRTKMRHSQKPKRQPKLSYHQKRLRLAGIILALLALAVFAVAFYFLQRRTIIGIP
jgi:hypothetical protein